MDTYMVYLFRHDCNNIIMKSCNNNSFYMGVSYRPTNRPSLQLNKNSYPIKSQPTPKYSHSHINLKKDESES